MRSLSIRDNFPHIRFQLFLFFLFSVRTLRREDIKPKPSDSCLLGNVDIFGTFMQLLCVRSLRQVTLRMDSLDMELKSEWTKFYGNHKKRIINIKVFCRSSIKKALSNNLSPVFRVFECEEREMNPNLTRDDQSTLAALRADGTVSTSFEWT